MLRLHRGAKQASSVQGKTPTLKSRGRLRKLLIIGGGVLLVVAVSAAVLLYRQYKDDQTSVSTTHFMTEDEAIRTRLAQLKANPVPASASLEKRVEYLDNLSFSSAENKDYKAAVAAFDRRVSLKTTDLDYTRYIVVADYYYKLGDKVSARRMLDYAELLLPKQDDLQNGYRYSNKLEIINGLRERYK